ncbi:MAG: hypothetical protein OXN17_15925 [Candidatus Poribacteria bacterium]|nr:hypothetical protein [Candidatus Poribacteria bacterium]MDE0506623.1 hypothetical protein [Candidatus Poribacteria bacterium]
MVAQMVYFFNSLQGQNHVNSPDFFAVLRLSFALFNPSYGLPLTEKRLTMVGDIDILLLHVQ